MSAELVRHQLRDLLKPLLPAEWEIIPEQRVPEKLEKTTVIIKLTAFERLPAAPMGSLSNEFTVTVASKHMTDQGKAEDAVDDAVLELVTAIDELVTVAWSGAKKVLVAGKYIGWDIDLTMTTKKE